MAEPLAGVIERVTFHNLDSGYCVLRVRATGRRDPVTVVGHLSQAVAGEYVEGTGEWVTDRSYGVQFKAAELVTHPPHTPEGIAKYLGSGLVKGIGPKYAKKIVEAFGDRTLEVIEGSVAQLSQVKGIGPKRIERIRESWRETRVVRDIMTFLMSYGVGTARAVRIYKAYGDAAIRVIQENPYRLSEDIWGVGFRTADELALKLGLPRDAPQRAQAAVRHVLREASGTKGHVGLPEPVVVEETAALTQISPGQVADAIEQLRLTDEVVRDSFGQARGGRQPPGEDDLLDRWADAPRSPSEDSLLYLKPLFLAELGVARLVTALRGGPHPLPSVDVDAALRWVEGKMGVTFAGSQRAAVRAAVTEKMLVVTGGPGTGKTTLVRAIIETFAAKSLKVTLAAPTGRAAKRLAESTGREAKTVHRVLEFDAGLGTFRRNRENPLDTDLLVVDETSMVDVVLMNQLLRAVPPWACVVFVGDVDQLPSVGAGSVLRDLIDSGVVPVARLTEIHRQAGGSHIVRAAHAVNHGEVPESAPPGAGDFYYVAADEPAAVIDRVRAMVRDRIPAKFGLDPFRDVQVLSPMNKSELGVGNLNAELQKALNPERPGAAEVQRFGTTFRVGDKILQTQNNYQREVFNGDIGRVTAIDPVDQVLSADFDGRPVEYEFADLDELQLAYAVSVHKAQGSEYPAVVIPVHTQHWVMLQRNLLYTGITRGRRLVVLVGKRYALERAITNAETARRFGLLRWRLRALADAQEPGA
jgi:exodeoxyribonuclease V alpha subunit